MRLGDAAYHTMSGGVGRVRPSSCQVFFMTPLPLPKSADVVYENA